MRNVYFSAKGYGIFTNQRPDFTMQYGHCNLVLSKMALVDPQLANLQSQPPKDLKNLKIQGPSKFPKVYELQILKIEAVADKKNRCLLTSEIPG